MTDWRENAKRMLRSVQAHLDEDETHAPYLLRRLREVDERAIESLRDEMTPPMPEETAHLYRTAEEVTAAQQAYARELKTHHEVTEAVARTAQETWNWQVEAARIPRTAQARSDDHASRLREGIARRMNALSQV